MMTSKKCSVRVEKQVYEKAMKVFEQQGLNFSTAIKIYMTKTANEKRIPLNISEK